MDQSPPVPQVETTPLLTVDRLTRRFGGRTVVDDVSLEVRPGEVTCLLGPSGCGKSTTLRIIAGIDVPDGGCVDVAGVRVCDQGHFLPAETRGIGYMFQDFALFPHLTVGDNVGFGLKGGRARQAPRIAALLEKVGLAGREASYPHELSGGEQQRVALARASAPRPRLLLADEPTGNLDETNGQAIIDLLFDLRDRHGATLIMVTHSHELAARCDRVIRLRDGRIETPLANAAE